MYYKETVIEGVTYYQLTPNGELYEVSNKVLTQRLSELREMCEHLRERIRQGD